MVLQFRLSGIRNLLPPSPPENWTMGFFFTKVIRSNFVIKLTNWEYWPFGIVQLPSFFYFAWLAMRAKSLTFFCGSNPGITMGGLFGESKFEVLQKVPPGYVPRSVLVTRPVEPAEVLKLISDAGLTMPVIFKPDLGERGFMVKRIKEQKDIEIYLRSFQYDFIIQELVDLPLEFGVFYSRMPTERAGKITSIVMKEMLSVEGNGKSTLAELILAKDRAKIQWETLRTVYEGRLHEVLPPGRKMEIVSIGNHCLGTKFINANHLINPALNKTFDQISTQIEGFFFGRFDLRCASLEDLCAGKIKVLELNGCGAEPAHIYDPDFPFFKAMATLLVQWKTIFTIAMQNRKLGYSFLPLKDAIHHYKTFKNRVQ